MAENYCMVEKKYVCSGQNADLLKCRFAEAIKDEPGEAEGGKSCKFLYGNECTNEKAQQEAERILRW